MTEDVQRKVLEHLLEAVDKELTPDEVTPEMSLRDDLGLDSLGAVEMVMNLEEEFGVSLTDEELSALSTVGDVFRLVEEKRVSQEE